MVVHSFDKLELHSIAIRRLNNVLDMKCGFIDEDIKNLLLAKISKLNEKRSKVNKSQFTYRSNLDKYVDKLEVKIKLLKKLGGRLLYE